MTEWMWVAFWLLLTLSGTIGFLVFALWLRYGGRPPHSSARYADTEEVHDYPDLGGELF